MTVFGFVLCERQLWTAMDTCGQVAVDEMAARVARVALLIAQSVAFVTASEETFKAPRIQPYVNVRSNSCIIELPAGQYICFLLFREFFEAFISRYGRGNSCRIGTPRMPDFHMILERDNGYHGDDGSISCHFEDVLNSFGTVFVMT